MKTEPDRPEKRQLPKIQPLHSRPVCLHPAHHGHSLIGGQQRSSSSCVKGEHDDPKGSVQEVHQRWLEISATAFHLAKPEKVRVEWSLFGDDLEAKKVIKQAAGASTVELAQGKVAMIKTKPTIFTYTPRHSVKTGSGRRARFKTIEATGIRFHGWAVRAYIGDQLAGEAYSIASIKKLVDGSK